MHYNLQINVRDVYFIHSDSLTPMMMFNLAKAIHEIKFKYVIPLKCKNCKFIIVKLIAVSEILLVHEANIDIYI